MLRIRVDFVTGNHDYRSEFLKLSTTDILDQVILGCEGLPYLLEGVEQQPWSAPIRCQESPSSVVTTKNVSGHCQSHPWLRTTDLRP